VTGQQAIVRVLVKRLTALTLCRLEAGGYNDAEHP
jgi:hypothetical protein